MLMANTDVLFSFQRGAGTNGLAPGLPADDWFPVDLCGRRRRDPLVGRTGLTGLTCRTGAAGGSGAGRR